MRLYQYEEFSSHIKRREDKKDMKQCPKCSERNTNDSQFCKSCGENLENVEIISEDLSAMADDFMKCASGLLSEGTKKAREAITAGAEKAKETMGAGKEKIQSVSFPKETPVSYAPEKQIQPEAPPQSQASNTYNQDTPSSEPQNTSSAPNEEIKCPKCGAVGCTPQYKQSVSGGGYGCCSGGLGALVLGPLGLLCGACGRSVKTKNTLVWICPKCGHEFKPMSKKNWTTFCVCYSCLAAFASCALGFLFNSTEEANFFTRLFVAVAMVGCIFLMLGKLIYKNRWFTYTDEEKQKLKRVAAIIAGIAAIGAFI